MVSNTHSVGIKKSYGKSLRSTSKSATIGLVVRVERLPKDMVWAEDTTSLKELADSIITFPSEMSTLNALDVTSCLRAIVQRIEILYFADMERQRSKTLKVTTGNLVSGQKKPTKKKSLSTKKS